jgi:uncharacterized membrane protein
MTQPRSDEMSLDIVLALFVGFVVSIGAVALAGGLCYLSGVAFRPAFYWAGLACGAAATVVTLRRLERSARSKAQ